MEDNLVKLMDESGYRHLINILMSIRSSQQENVEKCISIWQPSTQYLKEKTVLVLDGNSYSEYVCEMLHVSSDNFENDKSYWKPISCVEFEGYTEEQLREWLGLSDEELETLSNIINDAEVQTNHAWSSSKIYAELLRTLSESKKFTISEISKIVSFSYKVVNDEADVVDDKSIYLVKNQATGTHDMYLLIDDSPSIVGNTNINLEGYIKKDDIVDSFDETSTYTDDDKVFSTKASKLMYDNLNQKKVDKNSIVETLSPTVTNNQIVGAKTVRELTIDKNIKTFTTLSQLGLNGGCDVAEIVNHMPEHSYADIGCYHATNSYGLEIVTGLPNGESNFILTIRKYNYHRVDIQAKSSASGAIMNDLYIGGMVAGGTSVSWKKVNATSIPDIPLTDITLDETYYKKTIGGFSVTNGVCDGTIRCHCVSPKSDGYIIPEKFPKPDITKLYNLPHSIDHTMYITITTDGTAKITGGTAGTYYYGGSFSYNVAEE